MQTRHQLDVIGEECRKAFNQLAKATEESQIKRLSPKVQAMSELLKAAVLKFEYDQKYRKEKPQEPPK